MNGQEATWFPVEPMLTWSWCLPESSAGWLLLRIQGAIRWNPHTPVHKYPPRTAAPAAGLHPALSRLSPVRRPRSGRACPPGRLASLANARESGRDSLRARPPLLQTLLLLSAERRGTPSRGILKLEGLRHIAWQTGALQKTETVRACPLVAPTAPNYTPTI